MPVIQNKDEIAYSGGFAPQIRALPSRRSCKHSIAGNSVRLLKPALIWDRVLTKAEAVSPLSPLVCNSCGPAACLSGIFGYFCFQDKSYSPISLRSKRGETAFDFRNPGGQPENRAILRAARRENAAALAYSATGRPVEI